MNIIKTQWEYDDFDPMYRLLSVDNDRVSNYQIRIWDDGLYTVCEDMKEFSKYKTLPEAKEKLLKLQNKYSKYCNEVWEVID